MSKAFLCETIRKQLKTHIQFLDKQGSGNEMIRNNMK